MALAAEGGGNSGVVGREIFIAALALPLRVEGWRKVDGQQLTPGSRRNRAAARAVTSIFADLQKMIRMAVRSNRRVAEALCAHGCCRHSHYTASGEGVATDGVALTALKARGWNGADSRRQRLEAK